MAELADLHYLGSLRERRVWESGIKNYLEVLGCNLYPWNSNWKIFRFLIIILLLLLLGPQCIYNDRSSPLTIGSTCPTTPLRVPVQRLYQLQVFLAYYSQPSLTWPLYHFFHLLKVLPPPKQTKAPSAIRRLSYRFEKVMGPTPI